ncbi:hypothetical protein TNCV_4887311 [Trichonephila clavipes]|nr:hypothetical protein TNCV_4887311 [Trichonephila clavipes]
MQEKNNSTRQHERNNSIQQEKTTQLSSRNETSQLSRRKQLNSSVEPNLNRHTVSQKTSLPEGNFLRFTSIVKQTRPSMMLLINRIA